MGVEGQEKIIYARRYALKDGVGSEASSKVLCRLCAFVQSPGLHMWVTELTVFLSAMRHRLKSMSRTSAVRKLEDETRCGVDKPFLKSAAVIEVMK